MNRRTLLGKGLAALALPLFSVFGKLSQSKTIMSPIAKDIEKIFLDTQPDKFEHYKVVGVWNDPNLHRQRRLGCYWLYEDSQGREWANSIDYQINDLKKKYVVDKIHMAWEDAVNEVHNKYTGENRREHSQMTKYMDA